MAKFQDLTGQRFERLEVLGEDLVIIDGEIEEMPGPIYWLCRCDCGKMTSVRAGNLKSGQVKSCGCLQRETVTAIEMEGKTFGRLTVVERAGSVGTSATWLCRCRCGKEVVVRGTNLRVGNTKSCGCQRSDSAKLTNRKHGMVRTSMYGRWENMKQRCLNPTNPRYEDYGGRGITICPEWIASFEAYYADVGDPPGSHVTLDRIDNDGPYAPGNVRWSTHSEQMKNRRPMRRMTRSQVAALEGEIERLKAELARAKTG